MNKSVDQYNNTYHHSINTNPINADYSPSIEKIETNPKTRKFKVSNRVRITKYNSIFSKGYTENWSRKILIIDFVCKINPWTYKFKDLNEEKIIRIFHGKELLLSILWMSYYPEPDLHIRDSVKVVLELKNYATIKELDHATGGDTPNLAA